MVEYSGASKVSVTDYEPLYEDVFKRLVRTVEDEHENIKKSFLSREEAEFIFSASRLEAFVKAIAQKYDPETQAEIIRDTEFSDEAMKIAALSCGRGGNLINRIVYGLGAKIREKKNWLNFLGGGDQKW